MRFRCTVESVVNEEISILAIIETVFCSFLGVYLAICVWESWLPLGIVCSITPLLMLRNTRSTLIAETVIRNKIYATIAKYRYDQTFAVTWAYLTILPQIIPIKVAATLLSLKRSPKKAITNIPQNWKKFCLSFDIFFPPEIVPGTEESSRNRRLKHLRKNPRLTFMSFSKPLTSIPYTSLKKEQISTINVYITANLALFAPSILYRYSLKSTAIVWLPILWITPKLAGKTPIISRLKHINKGSWGRFMAAFSCVSLMLIATKVVAFKVIGSLIEWWDRLKVDRSVVELVSPFTLPPWQIASGVNALLTIGLYFFASHFLIEAEDNGDDVKNSKFVDYTVRWTSAICAILSLYSISCLLYIVYSQVSIENLPPIGDQFFPWR